VSDHRDYVWVVVQRLGHSNGDVALSTVVHDHQSQLTAAHPALLVDLGHGQLGPELHRLRTLL
jgi:hypothetical protein